MKLSKYIACICEGAAEAAIMDILLDSELLIFSRDEILEESVIRYRGGKKFEERYLRKQFTEKISILRILDSRREDFKVGKAYQHKVDVINIITAPEIEMLIIHAEGAYKDFKKSKQKPSEYCKMKLKIKNVKSYDFIKSYFSSTEKLVDAIMEYRRVANVPKGEYTLADLLK